MSFARKLMVQLCVFMGAVVSTVLAGSPEWATPSEAEKTHADIRGFFSGFEQRLPGWDANRKLESKVRGIFASSGLSNGVVEFDGLQFTPGRTTVTLDGQESIAVMPMHPSLFRPGNFPTNDFTTGMVYLGHGTESDLLRMDGVDLKGTIALMDFDCGDNWLKFLRFGVKGFVFLAPDEFTPYELNTKVFSSEVSVPRFYVTATEGLRLKTAIASQGTAVRVHVQAEPSRWKTSVLNDCWAFIPGSDAKQSNEVMLLVAPMDSNCLVPGLGEGAQSAANLYLLLEMFEEYRRNPPARSVMVVAVNGHTQKCLGERVFSWYAISPRVGVEGVRDDVVNEMRMQSLYTNVYGQLKLDGTQDDLDAALLANLRTATTNSVGNNTALKKPIQNLAKRDVSQIKSDRVKLIAESLTPEEVLSRRATLSAVLTNHVNVLTMFNKIGMTNSLPQLTPKERECLHGYVDEIMKENTLWAGINEREYERDVRNGQVADVLKGKRVSMVFYLGYNWRTDKLGLTSDGGVGRWSYDFGKAVTSLSTGLVEVVEGGRTNMLVDTLTNLGGLPESHYFPSLYPGMSVCPSLAFFLWCNQSGTPSFGLMNCYADSGNAFSPADTFDNLDAARVASTFAYTKVLLTAIVNNARLTQPTVLPEFGKTSTRTSRVKTFKFDEFASERIPNMAVPGAAVIVRETDVPGIDIPSIVGGDVINAYMAISDERAVATIYNYKNEAYLEIPPLAATALRMDRDFVNVEYAVDAGEAHVMLGNASSLRYRTQFLPLFECYEIPLYERNDPSFVSHLKIQASDYMILDARRDAAPVRYGFTGMRSEFSTKVDKKVPLPPGPAAIYLDEKTRVKVLKGSLAETKRLALNADDGGGETNRMGIGFSRDLPMNDNYYQDCANDMSVLNRYRTGRMQGVTDALVHDFIKAGDSKLSEANKFAADNQHIAYLGALYQSLGAHVKAYQQTTATTNDMLKAVVFYMMLMLPFCFFLQRLLFKTVRIEAQMGIFLLLFVATYIGFRFIHPAFRIAKAPEAMFIAFIMGALGAFVINILHGRFEGEMQLLFRTLTAADSIDVGAGAVGGQAMLIGVNNMKRRRIRTALTTGTIVLVTFTMLAFTSVSKKLSPTVVAQSKLAPYTGILYHWPGTAMDEGSLQVFKELFARSAGTLTRRWLTGSRPDTFGAIDSVPFPVRHKQSGIIARIDAFLGLQTVEDGFVEKIAILPGGTFFSSDDARELVLPLSVANSMNIDPSDLKDVVLQMNGYDFKVVGVISDERLRAMKDLDGESIVPIKTAPQVGPDASQSQAPNADDATAKAGTLSYDTSTVLLMPEGTCRRLGGKPYSISIKLLPTDSVWEVMSRLLTICNAKFYISSITPFPAGDDGKRTMAEGIYYVGSNYRTSIGGMSRLIIPLLIASTIILNTMLGSVFERKAEIAIYNAVGLNPTHIGFFFLAESFVFSIIGSVGGYLIGQILALVLNKGGWISDINLNFSSLSVVYVIAFTITIVLLSTLYPATVATRAAVPSGKRKWSMPDHKGDEMDVVFPFIYQENLVVGIMHYLAEYFGNFTEASVGDMTASLMSSGHKSDAQGRMTCSLQYRVALAPYDLGVTQLVHLHAAYDSKVQAHQVTMRLSRVSGQDNNWIATNKPYLERLRKYLLHWRNMSQDQHALHVEQGRQLFDG